MQVAHQLPVCFKQKTAYEMLRSLVGSEMCIRDRVRAEKDIVVTEDDGPFEKGDVLRSFHHQARRPMSVSYTHLTLPTIYSV